MHKPPERKVIEPYRTSFAAFLIKFHDFAPPKSYFTRNLFKILRSFASYAAFTMF